ncbi:MAG: hypothetical protein SOT09_05860, partial [Candidatus Borkfalkiaceae bacterium]|nr:hypothetical protein [Christensenellaceae bacterium]
KKQLNLIIGFDTINYNLKIMRVLSRDVHSVKVDFVSVNQDYFIRGEWEKILAEGLPEYMSKQSFDQSFAVHLVLPDGVIGADVFNVPTLKRAKMETALETSLKDLYFFYNDYKFNKAIVSSNKTNTTFEVIMASKSLLNRVYKSLNELKLYVKNATFAANATVNAALALRPKNKKQSFIMLDISPESARVIAVSGGQTVGWKQLKFGYNVFAYEKVMIENNIVFNDIAQIAVINATEKAKKKKITEQIEEEDDDSAIIEENAIVVNEIDKHSEEINKIENNDLANVIDSAEAIRAEKDRMAVLSETANGANGANGAVITEKSAENANAAENATGEAAANNSADNGNAEAAATSTEVKPETAAQEVKPEAKPEIKPEIKPEVKPEPVKVKAYQRKIKKLPAYMQRPVPETIEGIRVENFRLFVKHVMLMKMQIEQGGIYTVPQYALVNMPKDYAYIIDETNKEDDSNGFEFRFFEPEKEDNVELSEHLDLFGALFMSQFNKNNNV